MWVGHVHGIVVSDGFVCNAGAIAEIDTESGVVSSGATTCTTPGSNTHVSSSTVTCVFLRAECERLPMQLVYKRC
jgi:hypothetical protein